MLSTEGWVFGISAAVLLIFLSLFGLGLINKSRKNNAKLLFYIGLVVIFIGFIYLGNFCDFLTILITGNNIDNTYYLLPIIDWIWLLPIVVIGMYIGTELLIPEKKFLKWIIISTSFVIGIMWIYYLFFDISSSVTFDYPEKPGEDLIKPKVILGSPLFILEALIILFLIIVLGFGSLCKGIKSEDIIRKKFLFLSAGTFSFCIFITLDGLLSLGLAQSFIRFGILSGALFYYLGLKEETIKKPTSKKDVKIESGFLRLIQSRPIEISEEEISVYREKKICLVCKGSATGFNIFVCPDCDVLYCQNVP